MTSERPSECRTKTPSWTKLITYSASTFSSDRPVWPQRQFQVVMARDGLLYRQSISMPGMTQSESSKTASWIGSTALISKEYGLVSGEFCRILRFWDQALPQHRQQSRRHQVPVLRRQRAAVLAGHLRRVLAGDQALVEVRALAGDEAGRGDQVLHLVLAHAVVRAGRGDHVLLDHDRAHVVRPEGESHLADLLALGHPARLEVDDVVQEQPRDRQRPQVLLGVGLGHV